MIEAVDNWKKSNLAYHGNMTKIDRYKWTVQDAPGQQQMVNKNNLHVDHTYQRSVNDNKLLVIARDWSWIACGSIVVADREGMLFVVDGQHRVMAARKRADITELPCLVFKTTEAKQEAKGFLSAQTQRKPITSAEKFRALVTVEDPTAEIVQKLLDSTGHSPGSGMSSKSVKCVGTMLKEADTDAATLCNMWPLIASLSEGKVVHARLIEGLLYIEKRIPEGTSLTDYYWKNRVKKTGVNALLDGATRAAALYTKGGAKVWAVGMVEAINKGHRNRLVLTE